MQLTPGSRLDSATGDGQVIVVRAPADEVDLRIGGQPAVPAGQGPVEGAAAVDVDPAFAGTLAMGKRYASAELGLEVLVTKAGAGLVSVGDRLLEIKSAKALPASD